MSRCPSQAPRVASTNHLSSRPALPTLVKSLESIPHNPSQPWPASVDSTFVSDISPYLPTKSCLSGTSNPTSGPSGSAHLASICILTSMSTSSSVSSSWGTTDVWGQIALCRGGGGRGCPVRCRTSSSILLLPTGCQQHPPPQLRQPKMSPEFTKCSLELSS